VVLSPGADVQPRELHAFVKEHIADFNAPQYVCIRSEPLPRNPAGKVLKPVLRDQTHWGAEIR
jgi:long-chain acyl-CoA synthetase